MNFIYTKNNDIAKELENQGLKLIQCVRNNEITLYVFQFNPTIYSKFSDKEIWLSNKLFF